MFDMFNNHPHWSETLNPGEEATLEVWFDPDYHGPEGVGVQQKAIRITAGSIWEPLVEMRLTATVVDEPGGGSVPTSPKPHTHSREGRR
ncbi:MAG TPA: hypothetical protein VNP04_14775 [Alphaproteobacteria bacterium]|nr:hypothetical protein [Alphaproteobacteria bacterium]